MYYFLSVSFLLSFMTLRFPSDIGASQPCRPQPLDAVGRSDLPLGSRGKKSAGRMYFRDFLAPQWCFGRTFEEQVESKWKASGLAGRFGHAGDLTCYPTSTNIRATKYIMLQILRQNFRLANQTLPPTESFIPLSHRSSCLPSHSSGESGDHYPLVAF